MLVDEFITVKWHPKNKDAIEQNGYIFTKFGDEKIYGYGNNTKEQFEEFKQNVETNENSDKCE